MTSSELACEAAVPSAPPVSLSSGDVLRVRISEAKERSLFAPLAVGGTVFDNFRIDHRGTISPPLWAGLSHMTTRVRCQVNVPFSRRATRWEKVAGRPDEGLFRYRDSLKEALIRPSGTFSHPTDGRRILISNFPPTRGRGRETDAFDRLLRQLKNFSMTLSQKWVPLLRVML
jgi:hypothetical protein